MTEKIRNIIRHKYNVWRGIIGYFVALRIGRLRVFAWRCWKLIKWLSCKLCSIGRWLWRWRTLNGIFVGIIFLGFSVMLVLATLQAWEVFRMLWDGVAFKGLDDKSVRNLIFSIGGVGAAIGLWFARERLNLFAAQVQGEIDQRFNDRLGRGAELLAREDNVSMRISGLSILIDLAHNATEDQKPVVGDIIDESFRSKLKIMRDDNGKRLPLLKSEIGQDVQNALNFLISLPLDERKALLPNRLSNGRLNFRNLDFSYVDFSNKILKNIDFSFSYIQYAKFNDAIIEDVEFHDSRIEDVGFHKAKLKQVRFWDAHIKNSTFLSAQITYSSFKFGTIIKSKFFGTSFKKVVFSNIEFNFTDIKNSEIIDVKFYEVNFEQGEFESKNDIKVSSKIDLPHFISADLGTTIFNFDDEIDPSDFFELCYYGAKQRSPKMDDSRRYYRLANRINVFVESDEEWSEKSVREWIGFERADREYERLVAEEIAFEQHLDTLEEQGMIDHQEQNEQESISWLESIGKSRDRAKEAVKHSDEEIRLLKRFRNKPKPKAKAKEPKPKKP